MIRAGLVTLVLAGCADETVSGYADPDATYRLVEIDGATPPAPMTITFAEPGAVTVKGACGSFRAAQTAPYPWFNLGPVTGGTCAEGDAAGARVFAVLEAMTLAEVQGPVLILSNDAGRQMVYEAR